MKDLFTNRTWKDYAEMTKEIMQGGYTIIYQTPDTIGVTPFTKFDVEEYELAKSEKGISIKFN